MEIIATGDIILTRRLSRLADPGFLSLSESLRKADIAFANLEVTLPKLPATPAALSQGTHMLGELSAFDELRWLGIDICSLANNHSVDYSLSGLLTTMARADRACLPFAGVGRTLREARAPAFVDTAAGRMALIATCSSTAETSLAADPGLHMAGRPGLNPLRFRTTYHVTEEQFRFLLSVDEEIGTAAARRARVSASRARILDDASAGMSAAIPGSLRFAGATFVIDDQPQVVTVPSGEDVDATARSVEDARARADFVAVSVHCHESAGDGWNSEQPAGFLQLACRRWIDSGADVVFGHGPHCLRGIEVYAGKPILYSLGNFVFMNDSLPALPPEDFLKQGLDPAVATVSQYLAAGGDGFSQERFWQAIVARIGSGGGESFVEVIPITLGQSEAGQRHGLPRTARGEEAESILGRLATLSEPYGTNFKITRNGDTHFARIGTS